jgi:hypothetical protein
MKSPRIFLAAVAATLLSSATAFAVPPSADQVTVTQGRHSRTEAKMDALFSSPQERMMFKTEMHQATRGMPRDQKKAYKKQQMQHIRAMNDADKAAWRQSLQAKWDALPVDRRTKLAQKIEKRAGKHAGTHAGKHHNRDRNEDNDQGMAAPQQQ